MKIQYRPEIDGLRAIAIISIVFYHSNFLIFEKNILPGGFLGVDIFFIISGYLITSIIFKEWKINNNFSLINFYERRARRIFPGLIIVILLSFPFAYHYLLASSFINYSQSIISAISFVSNFFFWYTKHQYNGPIAIENPFLHTWSLSVEEQFYIIFPIFLIFILKYLKKKFFIILLSIIFISLTLSQIGSKIAPTFNFFLPHSRIWELLLGSILALLNFNKKKYFTKINYLKKLLPKIGLFFIIYSIFFFNEANHTSTRTLIPTLGTCLIIYFADKNELITKILSLKPLVFIGLISYSLYLFHYPLFSFFLLGEFFKNNIVSYLSMMVILIILSLLSYLFVEKIFRNKKIVNKKNFLFITLGSILIILLLNIWVISKKGLPSRFFLNDKFTIDPQYYGKIRTEFRKGYSENFNNENSKKILIIGNSHGQDTFNMFYQNKKLFKEYDFQYFWFEKGQYQISCLYKYLKENATYCRNNYLNDKQKKLFNDAEYILLSTNWTSNDLKRLDDLIKKIKEHQKKIIIFDNTIFSSKGSLKLNILDYYAYKSNKLPNLTELNNLEKEMFNEIKNQEEINNKLEIIAKENNVTFYKKKDYLCNNKKRECELFTPEGYKIYSDNTHLTLEGAKYIGEKIFKYSYFKIL